MTALVRYDKACQAIAAARSVDEVKDIRDIAIAQKAYAKQAKNKDLERDAVEIRERATRRLGELIRAQKETVGLAKGGEQYHKRPTGTKKEPVPTSLEKNSTLSKEIRGDAR